MSVRHGVLGLLSGKDMHGYELKSKFDDLTGGFWQLNFGQVYSTLDRLVKDGLVERIGEQVPGPPDRKVFRITMRGRRELDDWVQLPVAQPRALRDDLFVRLLFCNRESAEPILRMINRHRDAYQLQMQKLSRRKAELLNLKHADPLSVTELLVDAALFHCEAELNWLNHIEQKVSALISASSGACWRRSPRSCIRSGSPSEKRLHAVGTRLELAAAREDLLGRLTR